MADVNIIVFLAGNTLPFSFNSYMQIFDMKSYTLSRALIKYCFGPKTILFAENDWSLMNISVTVMSQ